MNILLGLLVLTFITYLTGSFIERSHLKSLQIRESAMRECPILTTRQVLDGPVKETFLVTGSAVISLDYFKRVLARIRKIFGGEIKSYQTLLNRARREALCRLHQNAKGAAYILNCRIETAAIGKEAGHRRSVASIEALAYATAVIVEE